MSIGSLFSSPQFTVKISPVTDSRPNPNPSLNFSNLQRGPSRTRVLSIGTRNGGLGQTNPHGVSDRDSVVIVDHGSRHEFVDMFRERTGYAIVEPAHMELAEPSIQDAFNSCVEQGANRVIVIPFFLLPGRHWKQHPGLSYMVTAPLGLHPLLVDVMNDRINHCLSHVAGDAIECVVCVGTGKYQLH
ncbi:putative sirohydrochlorin ferrochelatase [Rosa chinensis]|uniref:Putative sirohydrochlorin ferrochelatase n=1 Tax=Rosa chinensis TaxID=74649 RepID=A0A2P6SGB7_ROSCH|nr:putative sirohydrochlorin ferrochelatase [Rosa chinensis]